jgi:hypothetical protein
MSSSRRSAISLGLTAGLKIGRIEMLILGVFALTFLLIDTGDTFLNWLASIVKLAIIFLGMN